MPVHILLGVTGLLVVAGGITGFVTAVIRWRRGQRAAVSYAPATGRVTSRYLPPGSAPSTGGPSYTIEFKTSDGRTVSFSTDSVGMMPKNVGDNVDVLYDRDQPDEAVIRGGERKAAFIFGISGFIFTIIGLLLLLGALDVASR